MKRRLLPALCLVMMLYLLGVCTIRAQDEKTTIIFTHDMHSRVEPYKKKAKMTGGFARLKTMIDKERLNNPKSIVIDGGDFSMGTLYQTIYETDAAELTLLGYMGYDVVTLGNHEFDYRSEGIVNMLESAIENQNEDPELTLPKLVVSSIDWTKNTAKENQETKKALDDYGSTPYTIIERDGLKIGIFGVMGEDADSNITKANLKFDPIVDTSKEIVKALKKEGAELIVCLSHSGTKDNKKDSEDENLAKEVPEIDVIVSGHTHTTLKEPIVQGNTTIVSSGNYGEALGVLDIVPDEEGRWKVKDYRLEPSQESIKPDEAIEDYVEAYSSLIDEVYLKQFGYKANQVLANNKIKFKDSSKIGDKLEEEPLGNLISDAYIYAIQQAEGEAYERVYATVAPSGVIRDTMPKGDITVSDVFNISSLGIGADRIPGYPLVSFYLTGKDIKTAAEIDASLSGIMTEAQLYPSGIKWIYNPNRMFLNKVTEVYFAETENNAFETAYKQNLQEVEDEKLYRVAAGLYSVQMLGAVEELSKGLLSITPKDKDGNPIEEYEDYIVYNQSKEELKEWYALAIYLESFDKNKEGISVIPERYSDTEGRKVKNDSTEITEILKNPNKFTIAAGIFILVILLLIILAVRIMIKKYKKRKRR